MKININESIYNLVNKDSKIIDILVELGFEDITKNGMINTVGRFMNLKKGSKMKNIPLEKIILKFEELGYIVEGNNE